MASITYQNEKSVEVQELPQTLLDISLKHGICHVHACGGHARCSTCRVMVHDGAENVLPRTQAEQLLAERKGFEPNVRLACQAQVTGPVRVRRLVLDETDAEVALAESGRTSGREQKLAILFSDIRDFTKFSEHQLPYDVIHMLNRYFREMGEVVLVNEGYIDKYIGDGMMALWGIEERDATRNCVNAVSAALQMVQELNDLNLYLKRHFNVTFGLGIGVHFGDVVLGQLGHPRKMQFTAIGDAVNVASRVESATKEAGVPLLISKAVYDQLGDRLETGLELDLELKGKQGAHRVFEVTGLRESASEVNSIDSAARAVRKALRKCISRRLAPLFLRLSAHDAMTYDPATRMGGANGSVRLPEELSREQNRGLSVAVELLRPIKLSFPEISWADLIALGGAVAVSQTGGPDISISLGRMDTDVPSPDGKLPTRDMTIAQMKNLFAGLGLSPAEMVALCGAHTIGRVEGVPFTEDPFTFSNSYYRLLLRRREGARQHMLDSDRNLLSDAECEARVEAFALDQELFFREFAAAYRKLTLINAAFADHAHTPLRHAA